jgi:hypothetical protein
VLSPLAQFKHISEERGLNVLTGQMEHVPFEPAYPASQTHCAMVVDPGEIVPLFNPHGVNVDTFCAHQVPIEQIVQFPLDPLNPALHWHALRFIIPVDVVLLFDPHGVGVETF